MKCFAAPRGVSLRQSIFVSSFSVVLSGRAVQWFTDNLNIPSIIRNGSMKRDLHEISLSIFKLVIVITKAAPAFFYFCSLKTIILNVIV